MACITYLVKICSAYASPLMQVSFKNHVFCILIFLCRLPDFADSQTFGQQKYYCNFGGQKSENLCTRKAEYVMFEGMLNQFFKIHLVR